MDFFRGMSSEGFLQRDFFFRCTGTHLHYHTVLYCSPYCVPVLVACLQNHSDPNTGTYLVISCTVRVTCTAVLLFTSS